MWQVVLSGAPPAKGNRKYDGVEVEERGHTKYCRVLSLLVAAGGGGADGHATRWGNVARPLPSHSRPQAVCFYSVGPVCTLNPSMAGATSSAGDDELHGSFSRLPGIYPA